MNQSLFASLHISEILDGSTSKIYTELVVASAGPGCLKQNGNLVDEMIDFARSTSDIYGDSSYDGASSSVLNQNGNVITLVDYLTVARWEQPTDITTHKPLRPELALQKHMF